MDVFVVPRRATAVTTFVPPLKPVEAMAVGLPLLVSDLPPLVEITQQGRFGDVATPQDPVAWAQAMAVLASHPARRHALGADAAQFVRRERTWEALAARYVEIYRLAAATE